MKLVAVIFLSAALMGAAEQASAQTNAPAPAAPDLKSNSPGATSAGGTNLFNNSGNSYGWGTNHWWTNAAIPGGKLPPATGTNSPRRGVLGPAGAPPKGLPTDVQVVVRQFQRESAQLAGQLNNASEAQRKQILQQLEALREQLQSQVEAWRETAKDQAKQMQGQFANPHAPGTTPTKGNTRKGIDNN